MPTQPVPDESCDPTSMSAQLRTLRELTASLVQARDVDDILRILARSTMQALKYEDCVIYLRTAEGNFRQRAAYGPKSPNGTTVIDPIELQPGEGIVGSAAASGKSIIVYDTRQDDRYVVDDQARLSELAVPIRYRDDVIGVVDSEHSEAGFFTPEDQTLVEDIAAIASARVAAALSTEALNASIIELRETKDRLVTLSTTDPLTGLGNRRRFEEELGRAAAAGDSIGVCVLDLDKFKLVNDTHGHHAGDAVLRKLAHVVGSVLGDIDASVSRIGGDELAVLTTGDHAHHIDRAAHAMASAVDVAVWNIDGALLDITISVGVSSGFDGQVWLEADEALLLAKADGGNTVVRYDAYDSRTVALDDDRAWIGLINEAVGTRDRFELWGQEVVPTPAYQGIHRPMVEGLIRYRDGDRTLLPDKFLGCAQRYGLTEKIDRWVINSAVEFLALNPDHPDLAINVSPGVFLSEYAGRTVFDALGRWGVDPNRLILEVTEHAAIEDADLFGRVLRNMQSMHVRVALDDLGSGWSSVAVIRDQPVDIVKIDGAWVIKATTDPVAYAVVKAICECAHLLGSTVVAEWVEDKATQALMESFDVGYVQGFLLSRPAPLTNATRSAT